MEKNADNESTKNITYVYDGVEVKLTGRIAETKNPMLLKKENFAKLYEIIPIDYDFYNWKKWVTIDKLYEVK